MSLSATTENPYLLPNEKPWQWAKWLMWLLFTVYLADLLCNAIGLAALARPDALNQSNELLSSFSRISGMVAPLQMAAYLAATIGFLWWWYRSVQNFQRSGFPLSESAGWSVALWLVPLVNLIWPYGLLLEATTERSGRRIVNLLPCWLSWAAASFLMTIGSRMFRAAKLSNEYQFSLSTIMLGEVFFCTAILLAFPIMGVIQQRQNNPT